MELEDKPDASIIIATYNRGAFLSMCLDAISNMEADFSRLEVIVIDNNSTDNTRKVIDEFIQSNPELDLVYLFEERQGASLARNRGIEQARGEHLYFLDDDAIPFQDWLKEMQSGFKDPSVGCIGGPAILNFQGHESPQWLAGDLKGLLSGYGLRYTQPTFVETVAEYPFLCNMAIRSSVLDEVGLLRLDLGPLGNNLVVGEETELIGRIRKAGWNVLYLPGAKVWHLVSPERLQKKYIYRSALRLAVTHIFLTYDKRIPMVLRWFASDTWYATRMFGKLILALIRRDALWFDDYMVFWMVAKRIPLRVRAHLFGKEAIARPK